MLTGILFCGKCNGPMYRHYAGKNRKDGTKYRLIYYRCHGTDTKPSRCSNMVPLDYLDGIVNDALLAVYGDDAHFERRIVSADSHAEEIADIERDIHELDLDDPDYDVKLVALRSERNRLKSLPAEAAKVARLRTGKTIGEVWNAMEIIERRQFLCDQDYRVFVVSGAPPEVVIDAGELEASKAARLLSFAKSLPRVNIICCIKKLAA